MIYDLFMNYVTQLEACGLWHWAIYILLHIPDNEAYISKIDFLVNLF